MTETFYLICSLLGFSAVAFGGLLLLSGWGTLAYQAWQMRKGA